VNIIRRVKFWCSCWFLLNQIYIHSRSWDIVVISYSLDGPELECRQGQEISSSPKLSRLALGPYKPPNWWLVGFLPGVNAANQTCPFSKCHPMARPDRYKEEAEICSYTFAIRCLMEVGGQQHAEAALSSGKTRLNCDVNLNSIQNNFLLYRKHIPSPLERPVD